MAIQAQLCTDNTISLPQELMETTCGAIGNGGYNESFFNLQPKNMEQAVFQQQQQRNHPSLLFLGNNNLQFSTKPNNPIDHQHHQTFSSMGFSSQSIATAQAEEQRQEIDRFMALQNERLRMALQGQRRQLLAGLLSKFESKALPLLRQKDEAIAQAAKRTAELEIYLRKLEAESHAWQRVAKEHEAAIVSLNSTIEEIKEKAGGGGGVCCNAAAELDAESCCDENFGETEEGTGESRAHCGEEIIEQKMLCQICKSEKCCVMFLPCRHLSSCKSCENLLNFCPICRTVRMAAIEVIIP